MKQISDEVRDTQFETWWEKSGQFCRAGGGAYEKTFAYTAWLAALDTAQPVQVSQTLLKALSALLTHSGMDEDEWSKPTFDQARAAIKLATTKTQECGMCGYVGTEADAVGQCPRCHWDELRPTAAKQAQPACPINCGTGHCSCIECPYEQAQPEPTLTDKEQIAKNKRDLLQQMQAQPEREIQKLFLTAGLFPDAYKFDSNGSPSFYTKDSADKFAAGKLNVPCKGKNCGSMNGWLHSAECRAEHEAACAAHLERLQQAQPERAPLICTWTQEDDFDMPGVYHTACGEMWSFTEGGIKENNAKFCQYCGGGIKQGDQHE